VWDLYGILFINRKGLCRILTDYGFQGHPLRKDFPLTGFLEIRYDYSMKRILYEKVEMRQEFRNYNFENL
jgi:NADH-quinone oxidoreductase subunit C